MTCHLEFCKGSKHGLCREGIPPLGYRWREGAKPSAYMYKELLRLDVLTHHKVEVLLNETPDSKYLYHLATTTS